MKIEYDFAKAKRGAVVPQKGKTRISIYIDNEVLEQFRQRISDDDERSPAGVSGQITSPRRRDYLASDSS
jgi:hypothetical protein